MQASLDGLRARARICNRKGLHARAAAKLVNTASDFDAKITVSNGRESAGATSILSLLMLAAELGVELEFSAQGRDAEKALAAIVALVERRFDETE